MNNGFIVLHRKILDHPVWDSPYVAHLFITLLLKASHKEEKFLWNGTEQTLKRGQLISGRLKLAEELGCNPSKIYRNLKILKNIGIVDIKSNSKYSLITILKYSQYQDKPEIVNIKSNNQRTTSEQPANTYNNITSKQYILSKPKKASPKSSFKSVEQLLTSKQKHLVLIGFYLKATKKAFDTPAELNTTINRWLKDAGAIAKFGEDKINKAFTEAREKYPDIWNLGTVLKILTK